MKILTDVVPRLELVETWTEDELITLLHEASHELGVVPKTFMTVLRHALSGMKVCETVSRSSWSTHRHDRPDPEWRKSWMLLGKSGAWPVCGVERSYLDHGVTGFVVPDLRVISGRGSLDMDRPQGKLLI